MKFVIQYLDYFDICLFLFQLLFLEFDEGTI